METQLEAAEDKGMPETGGTPEYASEKEGDRQLSCPSEQSLKAKLPMPSLAASQGFRREPDRAASPYWPLEPSTYVLRWPITGTIICRCSDPTGDPDVESLVQHLEDGIFADCGAPAVKRNGRDMAIEHYFLFYDGGELKTGQHFSFYSIPEGAYIDVARRPYDPDAVLLLAP